MIKSQRDSYLETKINVSYIITKNRPLLLCRCDFSASVLLRPLYICLPAGRMQHGEEGCCHLTERISFPVGKINCLHNASLDVNILCV